MNLKSKEKNYKVKLISIALILSIFMQFIVPLCSFASTSFTVTLKCDAQQVEEGDTVVIEMYVRGGPIRSFSADIAFDDTIFSNSSKAKEGKPKVEINEEINEDEDWELTQYNNSTGSFEIRSLGVEVPEGLPIGTLTLKAIASADSVEVRFDNCVIVDDDYNPVEIENLAIEIPTPLNIETYNITYNANPKEALTHIINNMPANEVKEEDKEYRISTKIPTSDKYTFKEWNTKADGTGTSYAANSTYTGNADLTLYAQWQIKQGKLTVNANGGTYSGQSGTKDYGTTINIPDPTHAPYAITFDANGGTGDNLLASAQVRFQNWTYTGGTSGKFNASNKTYTYDDKTTATLKANYTADAVTLPTVTKEGYEFNGWSTQKSGGTTKISATATSYTPTVNGSVNKETLYAQWKGIKYNLSFNLNTVDTRGVTLYGTPTVASGSLDTKEVTTGETYTNLPVASLTGYTFKGWNTRADGTGTTIKNYDAVIPGNMTVYGQWEAKECVVHINPLSGGEYEYTDPITNEKLHKGYPGETVEIGGITQNPNGNIITFDTKGGTITGKFGQDITDDNKLTQTVSFEEWVYSNNKVSFGLRGTIYKFEKVSESLEAKYTPNAIKLPNASKPGYALTGWKVTGTNGAVVGNAGDDYNPAFTSPNAAITLEAQWTKAKYTVEVDPNGGTNIAWGETNTQVVDEGYLTLPIIEGPDTTYKVIFKDGTNVLEPSITQGQISDNSNWEVIDPDTNETIRIHNDEGTGKIYISGNTKLRANFKAKDIEITRVLDDKEGLKFDGWVNAEGQKVDKIEGALTSNKILYAKWTPKKYVITIDAKDGTYNGATGTTTLPAADYNTIVHIDNAVGKGNTVSFDKNILDTNVANPDDVTQVVDFLGWTKLSNGNEINKEDTGIDYTVEAKNEKLTARYNRKAIDLPVLADTATSKFLGWSESSNSTTPMSGTRYTPESDITLYAVWQSIEYTLTIEAGAGRYRGNPLKGSYNQEVTLPTEPIVEPPHGPYTVILDKKDGTDSVVITQKTAIDTDKWEKEDGSFYSGTTYTITKSEILTINYKNLPITLENLSRTGYEFGGWYTSETEQTAETKVEVGEYMPTENITLYAKWTPKTYKILFNSGTTDAVSGLPSPAEKEVVYGESYGELPRPTRAGFDFEGWKYQGQEVQDNGIYTLTENMEIVAQWAGRNEYKLIFDYNGGVQGEQERTVRNGRKYGIPALPTTEKQGYTFEGWEHPDGTLVYEGETINLTSDETLKARFEVQQYYVTFKNDDGAVIVAYKVNHGSTASYTGENPVQTSVPEGYTSTFKGWKNALALQCVTQPIEVVAEYELTPVQYTITYQNLKGADNSENPTTFTLNDTEKTLKKLSNVDNFMFDGWYASEDVTDTTKITSIDTTKPGNITLYARWIDRTNVGLYLDSEAYKIGEEGDIDTYNNGDLYINKILPNTTLSAFKANCSTNGVIQVFKKVETTDENGQKVVTEVALTDEELIGTGMTIKVTKDDEEIVITAVVMGDSSGDGICTAQDLSDIIQAALREYSPEGAKFLALDVDDNNKLTASDLSTILQANLKTIEFTYEKPNK